MRRLLALALVLGVAAVAAALVARAHAAAGTSAFRTPDAGAACRLEANQLVCSSLGSPGSVALPQHGGAAVVDRLPWWDASTPVLHHWSHGALDCDLTGGTILCRNGDTAVSVAASGFAVAG